ncbi:MAG: NADH-quinone oxidoreductase subunit M [Flavobacteriales bacterium]|nr:NADH-quinone oxidoreductase subunit M [Flavobacteriales bacterium]
MILIALLLIPFLTGTLLLVARPAHSRVIAMISALACAVIVLAQWWMNPGTALTAVSYDWVPAWGLRFVLGYDGIGLLMLVLTAVIFPFIIAAGAKEDLERPAVVNALLLFTQSFLFGVFMSQNAFLFYIFYELSLLPLFFFLLFWGGANRRAITMRFFIYTLFGGLALLFGIAYCVVQEPTHSADFTALHALNLPYDVQVWLFWALFLAFAVKLPIFPFHSWQPDTYTMAPLQGTMVLGGVLLKMGLFGVLRFVFPIVPEGVEFWRSTVIWLAIIGALYAGWIAFRQTDLKRLVAYSSLSHVGILCAGLFAWNTYGISGSLYQAFAHAVLVVSMLYLVGTIQRRTGTLDLGRMGGLKLQTPKLAALFFLVMINAVALPLTQSFVGEWLMFNGLWQMENGAWMAVAAVSTIILGAVYMLYAFQRVMLGPENTRLQATDADGQDHLFLVPLIAITLVLGVYPAPILDLVAAPVQQLLSTLSGLN